MDQLSNTLNPNDPAYTELLKKSQRRRNVFVTVLLVIGLGLTISSLIATYKQYTYSKTLATAQGIIVKVQVRTYYCSSRKRAICKDYSPTITFIDAAGQQHTFTNYYISSPNVSKVGNQVDVAYEPNNPEKAQYKSTYFQWAGTLVITGFGLLITLLGIFAMLGKVVATKPKFGASIKNY